MQCDRLSGPVVPLSAIRVEALVAIQGISCNVFRHALSEIEMVETVLDHERAFEIILDHERAFEVSR